MSEVKAVRLQKDLCFSWKLSDTQTQSHEPPSGRITTLYITLGLCCPLSSGFVIFYDILRRFGSPRDLGDNSVFQVSLSSFSSWCSQAPKTVCVQRRRPLPLITNLLWTFWHTQGDSEVLAGGKWGGGEDDLIISQMNGPAILLCPPHSSPQPAPSSSPPPSCHRMTLCCLVH